MHPTTYSIVGVDRASGEIGVAVASKFLSVGAVVPFVRAGVGAIATQAFANTTFGPRGLDLLATGTHPSEVADALVLGDPGYDDRQFGIVSAEVTGGASWTGTRCIPYAGGAAGDDFAAQGNCLAGPAVVDALAARFAQTSGPLSYRLLAALQAGEAAGGDKRGRQSAALVIEKPGGGYAGFNDRYVDLRVDDHPVPVAELARLLDLHALYHFAPEPHDVLPIDAERGAEIVRALARIGKLPDAGRPFDETARAALIAFMHVENLESRVRSDGAIDRQTLAYLQAAAAS